MSLQGAGLGSVRLSRRQPGGPRSLRAQSAPSQRATYGSHCAITSRALGGVDSPPGLHGCERMDGTVTATTAQLLPWSLFSALFFFLSPPRGDSRAKGHGEEEPFACFSTWTTSSVSRLVTVKTTHSPLKLHFAELAEPTVPTLADRLAWSHWLGASRLTANVGTALFSF